LFGADAARLLAQVDAELRLTTYEKSLLQFGQVFFGIGLETLNGQRAAVEFRLVQENVMDVGISQGGRFQKGTQIAFTGDALRLSIRREENRRLSLYLNGQLLGESGANFAPEATLTIYLYTSTGGVLVEITSLTIKLDAR
jgi:hypothetical protein